MIISSIPDHDECLTVYDGQVIDGLLHGVDLFAGNLLNDVVGLAGPPVVDQPGQYRLLACRVAYAERE